MDDARMTFPQSASQVGTFVVRPDLPPEVVEWIVRRQALLVRLSEVCPVDVGRRWEFIEDVSDFITEWFEENTDG